MSDLVFSLAAVNPKLCGGGLEDAFQMFVADALRRDNPDAHFFPCSGKDGSIDGTAPSGANRKAIECKQISRGGFEEAMARWQEVADRLERNISVPGGPPKGQSQYQPWYNQDTPFQEYVFAISSVLPNQACVDRLTGVIQRFFHELGTKHSHLSHLSGLSVEVADWTRLTALAKEQPYLVFRWFPGLRPVGLIPFDEPMTRGALSSYLTNATLPYYSRAHHLQSDPPPSGVDVADERMLLDTLASDPGVGLVITGAGGVGKTRLALQIGGTAHETGWCVLSAGKTLDLRAIDTLAERLRPQDRVLLIIDYVEMRPDFPNVVDRINDLNDTYHFKIGYVATCRESYYQRKVLSVGRHSRIDLSFPPESNDLREWLRRYRQSAVRHILQHSGLVVNDDSLRVCRDVPILAVFMSYLRKRGRDADLRELLTSPDFGSWVSKRMVMTHPDERKKRDLALLMCGLPLPEASADRVRAAGSGQVLDDLAGDGWTERIADPHHEGSAQWCGVHDVIADQVVLSYCAGVPATVPDFVADALRFGREMCCLRSVLLTLQRVAGSEPLHSQPWFRILSLDARSHPTQWSEARDLLLTSSLLESFEVIDLLDNEVPLWTGVEKEEPFQSRIGWLARQTLDADQADSANTVTAKRVLADWIARCVPYVGHSNYVLTSGMLLAPEKTRPFALQWLNAHRQEQQAHYLLVAWLNAKCDPVVVRDLVLGWVAEHPLAIQSSFLFPAWFKATRETECLAHPLRRWLRTHCAHPSAEFVIVAWLRAGGALAVVEDAIHFWLGMYGSSLEAGYVYGAWLGAQGDLPPLEESILEWLKIHGTTPKAGRVYAGWLKAGGNPDAVRTELRAWLAMHGADVRAARVHSAWLEATKDIAGTRVGAMEWLGIHGVEHAAVYIYSAWLKVGGRPKEIRQFVRSWIAQYANDEQAAYVYKAWLDAGGDFPFVRDGIGQWLHQHGEREYAVYLLKSVVKRNALPIQMVKDCLRWAQCFPAKTDAIYRVSRMRHLLGEEATAPELCETLERVIPCVDSSNAVVRNLTTRFLADLARSVAWDVRLNVRLVKVLDEWMAKIGARFICRIARK